MKPKRLQKSKSELTTKEDHNIHHVIVEFIVELSSALSKSFKTQANTTPCLMSALPTRGASAQSQDGNHQRQEGRTARVVKVYSLGACLEGGGLSALFY